jgi:hypothetical protein
MTIPGARRLLVRLAGLALLGTGLVAGSTGALAQTPTVTVVASGLDNPRGVLVNGSTILVAEAGTGGTGPCVPGPRGTSTCLGLTGAVTAVKNGKAQRVVTGLPSMAGPTGNSAIGIHGLARVHGRGVVAALGAGLTASERDQLGPDAALLGQLAGIQPGHPATAIADLARWNEANDPYRLKNGESDPFQVAAAGTSAVVADAAGSDLLSVDSSGAITDLATFMPRPVTLPNGTTVNLNPVPTAVARGADGAFYVGELTGGPFPPGAAQIWRVVRGQQPTVYATGFTNIIGMAFDRQGRLDVLEIAKNGLASGDPTGALFRLDGGERTELVPGQLTNPGGIAVAPDGSIYVTTFTSHAGTGQLVRVCA